MNPQDNSDGLTIYDNQVRPAKSMHLCPGCYLGLFMLFMLRRLHHGMCTGVSRWRPCNFFLCSGVLLAWPCVNSRHCCARTHAGSGASSPAKRSVLCKMSERFGSCLFTKAGSSFSVIVFEAPPKHWNVALTKKKNELCCSVVFSSKIRKQKPQHSQATCWRCLGSVRGCLAAKNVSKRAASVQHARRCGLCVVKTQGRTDASSSDRISRPIPIIVRAAFGEF